MLLTRVCEVCKAEFQCWPYKVRVGKGRFCSRSCVGRVSTRTHGASRTRLHLLWCSMKARCLATDARTRVIYKDRGIRVCDEWIESFEKFRDWAIAAGYADGLQIDRIDNDKGYEPGNCRWATAVQQACNKRKCRRATTSRFRGVSWCANVSRWRAVIKAPGAPKHLGLFDVEEEAARAYDRAARRHFGEFASLNFKD